MGWATEAQAPSRGRGPAEAAQGAASEETGTFGPTPSARDVASPAPRVEPTLAPMLRTDLGVFLARPRPLRLPPRPLFRAGQPPPPRRRGGRREGPRARHAGPGRPHREGAEPRDGAQGYRTRRPLPREHPPLPHAGSERARIRPHEFPAPLSRTRKGVRGRSTRPLQFGVARTGHRSARRPCTNLVTMRGVATLRPRSS